MLGKRLQQPFSLPPCFPLSHFQKASVTLSSACTVCRVTFWHSQLTLPLQTKAGFSEVLSQTLRQWLDLTFQDSTSSYFKQIPPTPISYFTRITTEISLSWGSRENLNGEESTQHSLPSRVGETAYSDTHAAHMRSPEISLCFLRHTCISLKALTIIQNDSKRIVIDAIWFLPFSFFMFPVFFAHIAL